MTHLLHKGAVTKVSQKKFNFKLKNTQQTVILANNKFVFICFSEA
tara:strand:+ start:698 stop:832 length:135 start_codon:yes stop_codon:yes gene_type:complete